MLILTQIFVGIADAVERGSLSRTTANFSQEFQPLSMVVEGSLLLAQE